MYVYNCKILRVIDGDTVDAEVDLGFHIKFKMKVRLSKFDAPELSTPEGQIAKAALIHLFDSEEQFTIHTEKDKQEKYGRYLGEFFDSKGYSINTQMILRGHVKK